MLQYTIFKLLLKVIQHNPNKMNLNKICYLKAYIKHTHKLKKYFLIKLNIHLANNAIVLTLQTLNKFAEMNFSLKKENIQLVS